jgi:hypothetical protein
MKIRSAVLVVALGTLVSASGVKGGVNIEVQAAMSSNWTSKLPHNASSSQRSLDSRREVISTRRPKRRPSPRRLCSPRRRRVPEAWSPPTADLRILRGHELRQRQGHAVFRGRAEAVPASLSSTPPTVASIRGHLTKRKFMYAKAHRNRFWVFGGVGTHL